MSTQQAASATEIDKLLDRLLREWGSLTSVAERWSSIDAEDQVVYLFEWYVVESEMARLGAWAADGLLSEPQRASYGELLALAEEHRPIIDRLWDDVPADDAQAAHG